MDEEFTRGCYHGFAPPGVLTDFGPALREPSGRLHWAGTETGVHQMGSMGGAVDSGRRAAREVVAAQLEPTRSGVIAHPEVRVSASDPRSHTDRSVQAAS
jgi:monoamine oxidase